MPPRSSKTSAPRQSNAPPASFQPGVGSYATLLVVVGVLSFANSLQGAFVFDDLHLLPQLSKSPMTWETVWTTLRYGGLRGIGTLSFMLNGWLGGQDVTLYHIFNIAIHLAAGLTLFGLVRRTLQQDCIAPALRARALPLGFAVALLWIVHPLQTQAVTYLVQRYESLMALFYLLTLYCTARSSTSARAAAWQVSAVACMWLGLLSKEVMVTAPLAVLLYDRVYLSASWRDVFAKRGWMYLGLVLPMVLGAVILVPLVFNRTTESTVGLGVQSVTPLEYAASQPAVIWHYLKLSIWPQSLCLDYEWPVSRDWATIWPPALALGVVLVLIALSWWRWPKVAYVATMFFLILAPTSSIVPIKDLAFEHRMYLPLAAVIVLLVLSIDAALRAAFARWNGSPAVIRLATVILLTCVPLLLGIRTVIRNEDYRSSIAIWTSTLRVRPQNARALHNLMDQLDQANRVDEAYAIGERIIEINRLNGDPTADQHLFLGERYAIYEQWPQAMSHFQMAIEQIEQMVDLSPAHRHQLAEAHISFGAACMLTERPQEASEHLRRALELNPESQPAQQMLEKLSESQSPAAGESPGSDAPRNGK